MDLPKGVTEVDARESKFSEYKSRYNETIGTLNISVDSNAYDMSHKKRGQCVVFNHKVFDPQTGCKERLGTDRNAQEITQCFSRLQFDVTLVNDATYTGVQRIMSQISRADHSDNDCVVVVVLTHGDEHNLYARNRKYPTETLFRYFDGNRCPTLVGKPKIFIIQACRGEQLNSGVKLRALGPSDDTDSGSPVYRIPTIADYLIYYSTAPGHYSFRNTEEGSYFIQTLAAVLNDYYYRDHNVTLDLVNLLTRVNLRVAVDFESNVPKDKELDCKKQMPCISSMLTRLIYFQPKPELTNILFQTFDNFQ